MDVEFGSLASEVASTFPDGWHSAEAEFRVAGSHSELEWRVNGTDGNGLLWLPHPGTSSIFIDLRERMYRGEGRPWLSVVIHYHLNRPPQSTFNYMNIPQWKAVPSWGDYALDLEMFPRALRDVPDWYPARPSMRQARIFDSFETGGPPLVDRPPIAVDELPAVLDYLDVAPAFLSERGYARDVIDGAEDVPQSFHTDGTWIWSADVAHYLRKHGTPPEPELVEHMRRRQFRHDRVPEEVLADAERVITGERQTSWPDADSAMLHQLRQRLEELGVAETAYVLGAAREGRWCLQERGSVWEVALIQNGRAVDPVSLPRFANAATYLIGVFAEEPSRARLGAPPLRQTRAVLSDWPIQPLGGDPALTLLRDKRLAVVPAGRYLVRYGDDSGNLTFADGTEFFMMSLRAERESQGQRRFRVMRPLYVLTGITVPWHDQPGGGTAYLLPRSITDHIAAGSIEAVA